MTQNDQAAMNEQLTQLRLQGLSIDGDNRYKQDLIDAIIGALLFGAQGSNPPPAGHWLEQFYVIGREEREALARVEAERDEALALAMHYGEQRNEAMSQLAEAVGLLRKVVSSSGFRDLADAEKAISYFLSRHAQAEQQEAQGAQGGGTNIQAYQRGWDDRAALATQPAVQDDGSRAVGPTHPYREEC